VSADPEVPPALCRAMIERINALTQEVARVKLLLYISIAVSSPQLLRLIPMQTVVAIIWPW
jgi:hypothetical protein